MGASYRVSPTRTGVFFHPGLIYIRKYEEIIWHGVECVWNACIFDGLLINKCLG